MWAIFLGWVGYGYAPLEDCPPHSIGAHALLEIILKFNDSVLRLMTYTNTFLEMSCCGSHKESKLDNGHISSRKIAED